MSMNNVIPAWLLSMDAVRLLLEDGKVEEARVLAHDGGVPSYVFENLKRRVISDE